MTQRYIITDGIKQKYAKKDRLKRKETEYVAVCSSLDLITSIAQLRKI